MLFREGRFWQRRIIIDWSIEFIELFKDVPQTHRRTFWYEQMEPIIIVSGLPRSGTSMMMKMLEAGGLELVVDGKRGPDKDNPKGYYEFEKVKQLKKDSSWLGDIQGKAVKIISVLLYQLPPSYKYKILFMHRNMKEILASQRKMLERSGRKSDIDDSVMAEKFEAHLRRINNWIKEQKNMECLYASYNEMIEDPLACIAEVNRFLRKNLDSNAMRQAIDNSLYRNRYSNSNPLSHSAHHTPFFGKPLKKF